MVSASCLDLEVARQSHAIALNIAWHHVRVSACEDSWHTVRALPSTGGPANANNYTGNCANFPNLPGGGTFDGNRNVDITDSSCSLPQAVTATGFIHINASGSVTTSDQIQGGGDVRVVGTSVDVKAVTSTGNKLYIEATDGDVNTESIRASGTSLQVLAPEGKIVIGEFATGTNLTQIYKAQGNISLQNVINSNGDVRIFANQDGTGSDPFNVGEGSINGVNYIHNNGTYGYAIYISNGPGTAGITYSGEDLLQVRATSGSTGSIILDGGANGNVELSSGDMNVDGAGDFGSGAINIFAPEVLVDAFTLSAEVPSAAQIGYINLVTDQIHVGSGGVTINVNGNGPFAEFVDLSLFPVGSYSVMAPADPSQPITAGPYSTSTNALTIDGSGDFVINALGHNNALKILGYPLSIKPGAFTINQLGGDTGVFIASSDGDALVTDLTLEGTIKVFEHTSGNDDAPGEIRISATSVNSSSGNILLDSSGTNGGGGAPINLYVNDGTIKLGGPSGDNFTLKSDGGSTGGTPGNILVGQGGTLAIELKTGTGISASALGGDEDGADITINSESLTTSDGVPEFDASGAGAGRGGRLTITTTSDAVAMDLSTFIYQGTGGDTGNGGSISVTADFDVSLGDFNIAAGSSGNRSGGTVNIQTTGALDVSTGSLNADGTNDGAGGFISLQSSKLTVGPGLNITAISPVEGPAGHVFITTTDGEQALELAEVGIKADGNSDPLLPSIEIHAAGSVSIDSESVLSATSITSSQGGEILLSFGEQSFDNTATINGQFLASSEDGPGGTVIITSPGGNIEGGILISTTSFNAGSGGGIQIDANSVNLTGADLQVNSTGDEELDGQLFITATEEISVDGVIEGAHTQAFGTQVTLTNDDTNAGFRLDKVLAFEGDVSITGIGPIAVTNADTSGEAAVFASGDLTFRGTKVDIGLGSDEGENWVEASNITITATGDDAGKADIKLGSDLRSNGIVTLKSIGDTGSVLPSGGGIKVVDDGANNQLIIDLQGQGTVGDPLDEVALQTEVGFLRIDTQSGGALVQNSTSVLGGLLVDSSTVAGDINITSDTGIELRSLSVPTGVTGNITVQAQSGALTVATAATIQTLEGNISLSTLDTGSQGFIDIGHLAYIVADSASSRGNISIFRGLSAGTVPGTAPAYVSFSTYHAAQIYWGNPTITNLTDFGPSIVCADGTEIAFNAAGTASKILLDANYIVAQKVNHGCPAP